MEVYVSKLKKYKQYLRYFEIKQEEVQTLKLLDLLTEIFTHESTRRVALRLDYEKEISAIDPNIDSINLPPDGNYYRIVPFTVEGYKEHPELVDKKRSTDGLHIIKTTKDLLSIGLINEQESEIVINQLYLKKLPLEASLFELIVENRINKSADKDKISFMRNMVYYIDFSKFK